MSAIDEVKQRTDIVEVVSQYTTLSKSGRILKGLCPFHSEKHGSFFVYPEQQSWHCFGACSTGGDVFSFVMKQQDICFGEALRLLAERAGVTLPSKGMQGAEKEKNERLYQANKAATDYFHRLLVESPSAENARSYIARRKLSEKSVADFELGYSPNSWDSLKKHLMERGYRDSELIEAGLVIETEPGDSHDRFRNKLIFPIADDRGRICGFGSRVLDNSSPKYVNSPETPIFSKSNILYGFKLARHAIKQQDRAVIVEGYMDVITAHQNGFGNVVASMGVAVTGKHINLLKRLTKNIVFALDADAAREEAMLRCVGYENTIGNEVKVIVMPQGKDPDDVIKDDKAVWQRFLAEAKPILDFTFDMIIAGLDLTRANDKTIAAAKLLPVISHIKDVIRQAHYLQKLSHIIDVDERTLEAAMKNLMPSLSRGLVEKPKTTSVTLTFSSSPLEDYCLSLLLQHPELKSYCSQILPEYFEGSENREIFIALKDHKDALSIKDRLDSAIWEHIDRLTNKELPSSNNIEQKLTDCISRLKLIYFKSLETKRGVIFASEAESKGSGADRLKLEEEGIEPSSQMRDIFRQRSTLGHRKRKY
ncbi:MAG TPA: DNA primase [Dehalococcoidia bacterium]|nr:DNA primase [Dehalococcoidia bacterium]